MAPINVGETKKSIFMYKGCANLFQHLRWMMQRTPRKYITPTYTKNNLRGDPERWKDVENDIKKDENC
jgi:hypothetical protein